VEIVSECVSVTERERERESNTEKRMFIKENEQNGTNTRRQPMRQNREGVRCRMN
jgi:hypothetical protein